MLAPMSAGTPAARNLAAEARRRARGRSEFQGRYGAAFVARLQADDGIGRPRGSGGGGQTKLDFAAGSRGERGGGEAGNLAQEFFQSFFVFRQ